MTGWLWVAAAFGFACACFVGANWLHARIQSVRDRAWAYDPDSLVIAVPSRWRGAVRRRVEQAAGATPSAPAADHLTTKEDH